MAACNNTATCTYQTGAATTAFMLLESPHFKLIGAPPYTFSFEYLKAMDASGDGVAVWLEDTGGDSIEHPIKSSLADTAVLKRETVTPNLDPRIWQGQVVKLVLQTKIDTAGNLGTGWSFDEFVVTNSGAWLDIGGEKAGTAGTPQLTGAGTLAPSSGNQLDLASAKPNATAWLVYGASLLGVPFKGGNMMPEPIGVIPLPTDAAGKLTLPFVLPPTTPPGVSLYVQFWIDDHGASFGLSASNGLKGVTSAS